MIVADLIILNMMNNLSKTDLREKNIKWINAIKALCIIFVFLRHCESCYGMTSGVYGNFYLPFYVNAFFFVSGYLLFWKQLSEPKILEKTSEFAVGGG